MTVRRLTFVLNLSMEASERLENQAGEGDPKAFGELIRIWDQDLRGVAWSVTRSPEATDDVMQSTYEKAFRSMATFDRRASLKTWLHSICYRTALDYVRYEGRRRHEDVDGLVNVASQESAASTALGRIELGETLMALEPEARALLMLTAGLGFSFDETAAIAGMERGTVASKVSRARARIQRWENS